MATRAIAVALGVVAIAYLSHIHKTKRELSGVTTNHILRVDGIIQDGDGKREPTRKVRRNVTQDSLLCTKYNCEKGSTPYAGAIIAEMVGITVYQSPSKTFQSVLQKKSNTKRRRSKKKTRRSRITRRNRGSRSRAKRQGLVRKRKSKVSKAAGKPQRRTTSAKRSARAQSLSHISEISTPTAFPTRQVISELPTSSPRPQLLPEISTATHKLQSRGSSSKAAAVAVANAEVTDEVNGSDDEPDESKNEDKEDGPQEDGDGDGNENDDGDEDEEEDEDDDEPTELSQQERMWMAHGWLINIVLVLIGFWILATLRGQAVSLLLWASGHDGTKPTQPPMGESPNEIQKCLWEFMFGDGYANFFLEILVMFMGFANFVVFAWQTEIRWRQDHVETKTTTPPPFLESEDFWFHHMRYAIELPGLIFFSALIVLRIWAIGADPEYKVYGHSAWWRYLFEDIFILCDIIALVPTILDFGSEDDQCINFLWFSMVRGLRFVAKTKSGKTFQIVQEIVQEKGKLLGVASIMGLVLWVNVAGMYFLGNKDITEEDALYEEASYKGKNWVRFESIPSCMYYSLINLLREHPLADVHPFAGFFAQLMVIFTVIIGVPIMAFPTGILGSAIEEKSKLYLTDRRDPPEEVPPELQAPEGGLTRCLNSMPWIVLTAFLAYGGVFYYFLSTAQTITEVFNPDPDEDLMDFKYKEGWSCFGYTIVFDQGHLALMDGSIGLIFFIEFILRLISGGVTIGHAVVDFLSSVPGIIHMALHFAGTLKGEENQEHNYLKDWMMALIVFRVLKLDRFFDTFRELKEIFYENRHVFSVTLFMGWLLMMLCSTLLYYTERNGIDDDVDENFASVPRGLWAGIINLHGEYPWCDFTAEGKAVEVFIGLFAIGLFCVPLGIFGNAYTERLDEQESNVAIETKSWQERDVPSGGFRRKLHDFLYGESFGFSVYFYFVVGTVFAGITTTAMGTLQYYSDSWEEDMDKDGKEEDEDEDEDEGMKEVNCRDEVKKQMVKDHLAAIKAANEAIEAHNSKLEDGQEEQEEKEPEIGCLPFCSDDENCLASKRFLHYVDYGVIVCFAAELLIRLLVHTWRYLISWVGWCDIVSIVAFVMTTFIDDYREKAMHPNYYDDDVTDDLIAVLLLFRLCRIFCLESLKPAVHVLYNVCRVNWRPLAKTFYCLICAWFISATLMFMFERDDERDDDDIMQKHRYRDIPTSLQFTLVHLKGDYPLSSYEMSTKIFLTFVIIFGIALIGAPTGVFAAGFAKYYEAERKTNRQEIVRRRIEMLTVAVARIQIQFKRMKKRREAGGAQPGGVPSGAQNGAQPDGAQYAQTQPLMDTPPDASAGPVAMPPSEQHLLQCSIYFREFMWQRTCCGNFFVNIMQVILVANVIATIVHSVPELREDESWDALFDLFELLCTVLFTCEYVFKFLAAGAIAANRYSRFYWCLRLHSILDLVCILPFYFRIGVFSLLCKGSWTCRNHEEYVWISTILESVIIIRAARILEFNCLKYEVHLIMRTMRKACANLWAPSILAIAVWTITSTMFMWLQCYYNGDNVIPGQDEEEWMVSIPAAMYWCCIFLLGEWANVDFTDGAGSRMCIFYCLFGIMVFCIPVGIIMDAVQSSLADEQAELDAVKMIDKSLRDKGEIKSALSKV